MSSREEEPEAEKSFPHKKKRREDVLRYQKDFDRVYRKGKSVGDRYVVVFCLKNNLDHNRISFLASKKVGNSVVRHRIKRRLKEIARLNEDGVKKGYDIVIIARNAAALSGYGELEQSYLRLLTKMHLMDMDAVR